MTEARDALATAIGKALHLCDPVESTDELIAETVLAALPDGWTLARRQDAADGAALRELREALTESWMVRVRGPFWQASVRWEVSVGDTLDRLAARGDGPTIAAAARKAKEALR